MATPKKNKSVKKKPTMKKPVKKAPAKKAAPKSVKKTAQKLKKPAPTATNFNWEKFIQPLQDRVVALEIEAPTTTESGLILVSEQKGSYLRARVVAAGSGRVSKKGTLRPLDVQVGDVILVTSHAGSKVTVASQEALIISEDDVLGIVSSPSL